MGRRRAGREREEGEAEKKEGRVEGWKEGGQGRRMERSRAGYRDGKNEGSVVGWEEGRRAGG